MSRSFKGKDLFYSFTTSKGEEIRFTPRQLIEALEDACDEMSYSNYHNDKFSRIDEIVRRYCEERKIPLGQSRKQIQHNEDRAMAKRRRILDTLPKDPVKALNVIAKLEGLRP